MILCDIGEGLPFKPGSFDGAISISTVQWLCNAFKTEHVPKQRIKRFFESLYACLRKGTRAVIQLYPEDKHQLDLITTSALRAGFTGGLVVDYPNSTKGGVGGVFFCLLASSYSLSLSLFAAKKMFLVLMCGQAGHVPQGLDGPEEDAERQQVPMAQRQRVKRKVRGLAMSIRCCLGTHLFDS